MNKKLLALFLTSFLLITSNINTFSINVFANSNYATSKTVTQTKHTLKITGYIPTIKNLTNPIFQSKLNSAITKVYNDRVEQSYSKGVKSLKFNYDIVEDGDIISIIIYSTNGQTSTSQIDTFVINKSSNSYVSINSFLGNNGANYANKVVENKIKQDSTIKYFGVYTVTNETPFYVKDKDIVVMFGAGSIAPVSKGVRAFSIPSQNITSLIIPKSNYYLKSDYNVKMIPLRPVTEKFGYTLNWNSSSNAIIVSKGNFSTTLTIGRNSYTKGNRSPSALEFAPEIKHGVTYVPISFFSEILGLLFAVDSNGNVTISQYTL